MFENFVNEIKKLGELQYSRGKYYNDKFCYIPYFTEERGNLELGVDIIPVRYDEKSYQKMPGYTIYKKPTKLESKTGVDLLEDVKKLMTFYFKRLFNIKEELVEA